MGMSITLDGHVNYATWGCVNVAEGKLLQQEALRSIMGRRATDVNHLAFSVAKVLKKETSTLGQVPTVGCQPGGLRMHLWFKWIKLGLPAAGSKQS